MDATLVGQEMIRRQYWCSMIDLYISQEFYFDLKSKIRRGTVQKEIGAHFGVTVNNLFCELVNIVMETQGYKKIINRGDYYYRGAKRK
jgi:hypothetical protein